jgi:outer membrane protein assembly factor BamB
LGGTPHRNNTPEGRNVPTDWDVKIGRNIKWSVPLGSQSYGNVVVANGQVYVGTNNGAGYLPRYPSTTDLGVLLCLRETDGTLLWQYSGEKLPTGLAHDWPQIGLCSSPVVEDDRLWFVTNRNEVVCLDAKGFYDDEDDGPVKGVRGKSVDADSVTEADVVWSLDLMKELGVQQHNAATCAPTIWGDILFICTSNGIDQQHQFIPAPDAPSFLALDKHTGKILWTDNSPGRKMLHGQWSCPAVGVFNNVPQVIFAGGDGWLYSFRADRWDEGKPIPVWKFDCNPKNSVFALQRGTRNPIIAVPVIHDGLVYAAVGEDPEHGEGPGHLWCVDPTRRGDVSAELVVDESGRPLPHQQVQVNALSVELFRMESDDWEKLDQGHLPQALQTQFEKLGVGLPETLKIEMKVRWQKWTLVATFNGRERNVILSVPAGTPQGPRRILAASIEMKTDIVPNPKSAAVWHYSGHDRNGNGKLDFEETMHRTLGSPAVKSGLLFISDASGLVHCLDAKTGQQHWTCDMLALCWTTPLIVADHVYVSDSDGDIAILSLSPNPTKSVKTVRQQNPPLNLQTPIYEIDMNNEVCSMPIVANGVLYIAARNRLYAIAQDRAK